MQRKLSNSVSMKRLKLKVLARLNVLLGAVLALFGCESCSMPCLYGTPSATFMFKGKVVNEEREPLKDIHVTVKGYGNERMHYSDMVTGADGQYSDTLYVFPYDTLNVVFTDTTQVYQADSTRVVVKWDEDKQGEWDMGAYEFEVSMQLKKNTEGKE